MSATALDLSFEVIVLATQSVIDVLADRIERAYRLRKLDWQAVGSTPRVWAVAAETLLRAHEQDHLLPLDPELFVAAQLNDSSFIDPWGELTGSGSLGRYRGRVLGIVRQLRDELVGEVRFAESRLDQGEPLAKLLLSRHRQLSPLGRFIVAHRAGRPALANRFLHEAAEQHRGCPLYRQATQGLLPDGLYPVLGAGGPPPTPASPPARPKSQVHLN